MRTTACGDCTRLDEADHRIANHLAMLASYVRLKGNELAKRPAQPDLESVRLLLEGICVQIQAVSNLHRELAASRQESTAELGQHLHELCVSFGSALFGGVEIIEDIEPGIHVSAEQILPLTQIFAEVVTNAIKHGQSASAPSAGQIRVRCRREAGDSVLLEISDSGPGLPEGFDPKGSAGLGFRLVRALGEQVGGVVAFESGTAGLRFRLVLQPAAPPDRRETTESQNATARAAVAQSGNEQETDLSAYPADVRSFDSRASPEEGL